MVQINHDAFADEIEKYLANPNSYTRENFDRVDSSLHHPVSYTLTNSKTGEVFTYHRNVGLRFDYNMELVMRLLKRPYDSLKDKPSKQAFADLLASEMEKFAEPFPETDVLAYPHFLLHGLEKQTAQEVSDKFRNNGRIIHETRSLRNGMVGREHTRILENGLVEDFDYGKTDDYFGIESNIGEKDFWDRLAKVSFFIDDTNKECYVITVQGQSPYRKPDGSQDKEYKLKSRNFARMTAKLGMDPRTFLLIRTMERMKGRGMRRVRVIRPQFHPMFIEGHKGFTGRYEPVIRAAGISEENECYLEADLK